MEKSKYEMLAAIDVSSHIEKKNNLSYLSWAWAVDQLMRADSAANWVYNAPVVFSDETMMVSCTVTAFGKPMTMHLPVMDFRNKSVKNPDAFAVNTAMMRCLVKAIALHGLGLYIYAGEDLPLTEDAEQKETKKPITPNSGSLEAYEKSNPDDVPYLRELAAELVQFVETNEDVSGGFEHLQKAMLDTEQKLALWAILAPNSKTRNKIKAEGEKRKNKSE